MPNSEHSTQWDLTRLTSGVFGQIFSLLYEPMRKTSQRTWDLNPSRFLNLQIPKCSCSIRNKRLEQATSMFQWYNYNTLMRLIRAIAWTNDHLVSLRWDFRFWWWSWRADRQKSKATAWWLEDQTTWQSC